MSEPGKEVAVMSDSFVPNNLEEVKNLATFMAASDLIPKSLGGRKENVAMVLLLGHEIGVPGIAALSNIYVVNGRPSIWGDLATALVRRSGLCEYLKTPVYEGAGPSLKVTVVGKRKGDPEEAKFTYSMEDAKLAGLLGKDTWIKSPKDMLFWKAFHRLAKFLWPDVLKGIALRETIGDEEIIDVTPEVVVVEPAKAIEAKPTSATVVTPEPEKKAPGRPVGSKKKPKEPEAPKASETTKEPESERPFGVEPIPTTPPSPAAEAIADIPGEQPMEAEAVVDGLVRVFGTVIECVKMTDPKTAKFIGYAVKMETANGPQKYILSNYDEAVKMKPFKGKTVEIHIEKMADAPEGVAGLVKMYSAVNP